MPSGSVRSASAACATNRGATSIAVTGAVIRFLLMPYTNFSISSFELAYGYYATSFLGNAKAYIILLTADRALWHQNHATYVVDEQEAACVADPHYYPPAQFCSAVRY